MRLLRSFQYAFSGLKKAFRSEKNFKIQFIISLSAILLAFLFHISALEWVAVLGCCSLVLGLELINSAIERLCNFVSPGIHPAIKKIKDFSAAAVLIASLVSFLIGLIIFLPKVYNLLKG